MENEIELLVAENQIGIDFNALTEEKEESLILPETLIKPLNHDYIKDEVLFVVVKSYDDEIVKNLPELKICGKKLYEWVLLAGSECEQKIIEDENNLINSLKSIQTEKPYIAVFYSDTPLLDKTTFNNIMDYACSKGVNVLQLSRGFIIKTEYLKNVTEFAQSGSYNEIEGKNLFRLQSARDINYVANLLNSKILNYHINNGVIILGQDTVFIDADVEIASGVVIEPNNVISGESTIESEVVLNSGNIIKDSIIGERCVIECSYISKSKLGKGRTIKAYTKIENEEVL